MVPSEKRQRQREEGTEGKYTLRMDALLAAAKDEQPENSGMDLRAYFRHVQGTDPITLENLDRILQQSSAKAPHTYQTGRSPVVVGSLVDKRPQVSQYATSVEVRKNLVEFFVSLMLSIAWKRGRQPMPPVNTSVIPQLLKHVFTAREQWETCKKAAIARRDELKDGRQHLPLSQRSDSTKQVMSLVLKALQTLVVFGFDHFGATNVPNCSDMFNTLADNRFPLLKLQLATDLSSDVLRIADMKLRLVLYLMSDSPLGTKLLSLIHRASHGDTTSEPPAKRQCTP